MTAKKAVARKAPVRRTTAKKAAPKSNARKTAEAMSEAVSNRATKRTAAKKAPAKKVSERPPTKDGSGEPLWEASASLGSNVDRLKTAGVTWKRIAEMANDNGHEMPWPDGGKLLRARKQFLAGTEGKVKPTKQKGTRTRAAVNPDDDRSYAEQAAERLKIAIENRDVPWDDETPDDVVLELLNGKRITFVSKNSGHEQTVRAIRNSKFSKIGYGADGRYYDFVTEEGPFMAISLSRMISVK